MKRNWILVGIGTLPLWVGIVLNGFLPIFPIPVFVFGIVYLLLWSYLCYRCCDPGENIWKQALLLCLFGFVMLALVAWQALRAHYWVSYFGLATQLYFLPALSLGAALLRLFVDTPTAFPAYVLEMLMLTLGCFGGCLLKARKKA